MSAQGPAADEASTKSLAERPKDGEDGDKGPSKNALKKAAKDKEKAGTPSLRFGQVTQSQTHTFATQKKLPPAKLPRTSRKPTRLLATSP